MSASFSLLKNDEARELLIDLEEMRTDVLGAMNAIEGVPLGPEAFTSRLKRMNKQGKIPQEILGNILLVAKFRNKAVYESY